MKKPSAIAATALGALVGAHQVIDATVMHPGHPDAPRPPKASIVVAASTAATTALIINTTSGAEHNCLPADGPRSTARSS